MADMAVHLEQSVLPAVPIRHWICSLPWGLRALLGYDKTLCSEVVSAFAGELIGSLKRRAKSLFGLSSVSEAHTGAVAAIQRMDSALRLNVHAHVLALDGVYVREGAAAPLVFRALPTPTQAEVADVARRTAARIEHILRVHGRSLDPAMQDDAPPSLVVDEPGLTACYAARLEVSPSQAAAPATARCGSSPCRIGLLEVAPPTPKSLSPRFEASTCTPSNVSTVATDSSSSDSAVILPDRPWLRSGSRCAPMAASS